MKNIAIASCAGLLVVLLAWLIHPVILSSNFIHFITMPAERNTKPAGELLANESLVQEIELPGSLFDTLQRETLNSDICVSMCMATYARTNTARYRVYLKQGNAFVEQEINALEIRDNSLHHVCFPPDRFKVFRPGSALLGIQSLDAKPGNAITLWLTEDTIRGFLRQSKVQKTLTSAIKMINVVPAGEMIAGRNIQQAIDIPSKLIETLETSKPDEQFCISLTMATYARQNTGSLELMLEQEDWRLAKILDVSCIRDNSAHDVCFRAAEWSGVKQGPALLCITGMDGQPGNAVTLWLTQDTSQGRVTIDGQTKPLSLHYSISQLVQLKSLSGQPRSLRGQLSMIYSLGGWEFSPRHLIIRNLLVIFYAFFVFMLVLAWLTRRKTSEIPHTMD